MMTSQDFFTDPTSDSNRLWTAAFLNERFPEPVSPLGWTLIRESTEDLALREPLRYLGAPWPADLPLTRLYRGHPYVDTQALWSLYKVFPDFLLPEDAVRYFPDRDVSLRKRASRPTSLWDPRVWWVLGQSAARDLANWSPWHNWRAWGRFEVHLGRELSALTIRTTALEAAGGGTEIGETWAALQVGQSLTRQLLRLHRWSLTHADLTYTLLRRLLARWVGAERAGDISARLVAGVPNLSLIVNAALARLAALRREGDPRFEAEWASFLAEHGHRSFSLDIFHPSFAAQPDPALALLDGAPAGTERPAPEGWERVWADVEAEIPAGVLAGNRAAFRHLLWLTRVYMGLREDQRYRWQQVLALMRRLALVLGGRWAQDGWLRQPDDVFFVTWPELAACAQGQTPLPDPATVEGRRERFAELQEEYQLDPAGSHPAFLLGDRPWSSPDRTDRRATQHAVYWGRPASPGLARGPVHRVIAAAQLGDVTAGEVLVARSTDPAWTPVFGRIVALVTETGGLLSHGAVVAREYGLPAVVAVVDIVETLQDGQLVEVDGGAGRVSILG